MIQEFNCTDIEQRLIEYAEGTLPAEQAQSFDAHLEKCVACAELAAEAKLVFASEESEISQDAPESLWRSIQNEINRLDKGRQKQTTLLSTRRPFVSFSLRTIGVAAALLLGIYLGGGSSQSSEVAAETYEDQLVDYYASAFQAESAIPVGEVIADLESSTGGGQ